MVDACINFKLIRQKCEELSHIMTRSRVQKQIRTNTKLTSIQGIPSLARPHQ